MSIEDQGQLYDECIMLMREHLAGVGIEATFADDVAMLAAREIRKLRKALEDILTLGVDDNGVWRPSAWACDEHAYRRLALTYRRAAAEALGRPAPTDPWFEGPR